MITFINVEYLQIEIVFSKTNHSFIFRFQKFKTNSLFILILRFFLSKIEGSLGFEDKDKTQTIVFRSQCPTLNHMHSIL